MTAERTMLSFVVGTNRFNYRVAGIALRDGHVLVCREDDDDWVMLPGGRVEMGEPTTTALVREIAEELQRTSGADILSLYLYDAATQTYYAPLALGLPEEGLLGSLADLRDQLGRYLADAAQGKAPAELHRVRNIRPGFHHGLRFGLFNAALETITRGLLPWTLQNDADHTAFGSRWI